MGDRTCDWGWCTPARIQKKPHQSSILSNQLKGTSWGWLNLRLKHIHLCKGCPLE